MKTESNPIASLRRGQQPDSLVECNFQMRKALFECLGASKQVNRQKPTRVGQQPSGRAIEIN